MPRTRCFGAARMRMMIMLAFIVVTLPLLAHLQRLSFLVNPVSSKFRSHLTLLTLAAPSDPLEYQYTALLTEFVRLTDLNTSYPNPHLIVKQTSKVFQKSSPVDAPFSSNATSEQHAMIERAIGRPIIMDQTLSAGGMHALFLPVPVAGFPQKMASALIVMDNARNILAVRIFDSRMRVPHFVNSSSIFALRTREGDIAEAVIWDWEADRTVVTPLGLATHDIDFNPTSETWLLLRPRRITARCGQSPALHSNGSMTVQCLDHIAAGTPEFTAAYESLVEVDMAGRVLWEWSPLSYLFANGSTAPHFALQKPSAYPASIWRTFSGSAAFFQMVTQEADSDAFELTRANTARYGLGGKEVYYVSKNLDTVFALSRDAQQLTWAAGRFGNLRCATLARRSVASLFYGPHRLHPLGQGRFFTFDNDVNNRDRMSAVPRALDVAVSFSRVLEFQVDITRGVALERWFWIRPRRDYNRLDGGGVTLLPNGNVQGSFASHVVEITRTGQIPLDMPMAAGLPVPWVNHFHVVPYLQVTREHHDRFSVCMAQAVPARTAVWGKMRIWHEACACGPATPLQEVAVPLPSLWLTYCIAIPVPKATSVRVQLSVLRATSEARLQGQPCGC
eukprot:NODE_506_length_2168_cov_16.359132_g464_i0.p1 GENE.NODE_506_length_2168_cov_16.359132_g464_i0~~NODE_506_length_2168_cov_16.359132_g464_i0.p1  ORF type:complete len:619 (-),score=82.69 NODE_506_length_2168_cov_16.359132_g464_i0:257-2113(-)